MRMTHIQILLEILLEIISIKYYRRILNIFIHINQVII